MWQGTSKLVKETAKDEDEALAKVLKRKDLEGYWEIRYMYDRD
jgi:hypothetical protein